MNGNGNGRPQLDDLLAPYLDQTRQVDTRTAYQKMAASVSRLRYMVIVLHAQVADLTEQVADLHEEIAGLHAQAEKGDHASH